ARSRSSSLLATRLFSTISSNKVMSSAASNAALASLLSMLIGLLRFAVQPQNQVVGVFRYSPKLRLKYLQAFRYPQACCANLLVCFWPLAAFAVAQPAAPQTQA